MGYEFAALADRKQRRPPPGPSYLADNAFRGRLRNLLTVQSSEKVAADVVQSLGYKVDSSIVRKLDKGAQKASRVVGYICRRYKWPLPPEARAGDAGLAELKAALDELQQRNPDEYARYKRAILKSRDAAREIDELDRENPDTPENSNH